MASKMLYATGKPEMIRSLVGEDITKEFINFYNFISLHPDVKVHSPWMNDYIPFDESEYLIEDDDQDLYVGDEDDWFSL